MDIGEYSKNYSLQLTNKDGLADYASKKLTSFTKSYTDQADSFMNTGESMAKSAIAGIQSMAEEMLTSVISQGVDAIYSAMGINKESIQTAQKLIDIAQGAISQITSFISIVPIGMKTTPSVKEAMSNICASYKDLLLEQYMSLKQMYNETIGAMITCMGNIVEVLKESLDVIIDQIIVSIDPYVYQYTGYHIVEIMQMCRKGISMFKAWKKAKKDKREKKKKEKKEREEIPEAEPPIKGNKRCKSIKVSIDADTLKHYLMDWLMEQDDALYNAFMLLNIKEMIMEIKDNINKLTNLSIEQLAENIESLDDVVNLLEELGLGDDTPGLSLQDAIALGMNAVTAAASAINDVKENAMSLANPSTAMAVGTMVATNTKVTTETTTAYDMNSESTEDYTLVTINVYDDPVKKVLNPLKSALSSIKTKNSKKNEEVFSANAIKQVLDKVTELWNNPNADEPYVIVDGKLGGQFKTYFFHIICQYPSKKEADKNTELNDQTEGSQSKTSIKDQFENKFKEGSKNFMDVVNKDSVDDVDKKRNTLQILKTIFASIKPLAPILKQIATLIQNYKINKEKVRNHAHGNLNIGLQKIMEALGLNKSKPINGRNTYTIRTTKLYNYCIETYDIQIDKDGWAELSANDTNAFKEYLITQKQNTTNIKNDTNTLIYFDMNNINIQSNYHNEKIKDGDIYNIDNICIINDLDIILYTDSQKSTMTSQIFRAIQAGISPY